MTPRNSLLQIAIVLALANEASALPAQNSPQNQVASAPQTRTATEEGVTRRAAALHRGAATSLLERKGATGNASAASSTAAPVRIAQVIKPAIKIGAAQPKTELSALEAQRAARREKSAREFMTARGFGDEATQNAIISHLQEQESAREELAQAGRQLIPTLMPQGRGALTDAQVETLVDAYQKQLATYNGQSQQRQAALDAQTGYSKKPRLRAMLLLMGALDQGPRIFPVWRPLRPEGMTRPRQPQPAL